MDPEYRFREGSTAGEQVDHSILDCMGDCRKILSFWEAPFNMWMCSRSLEHTGEIIQVSKLDAPLFAFEPVMFGFAAHIGDFGPLVKANFLFDGAGDLNTFFCFEIGV